MRLYDINPNDTGVKGELFGIPMHMDDAKVVLIPVPWEVTASGGTGASLGPESILKSSYKLDLYDPDYPKGWEVGMVMLPIPYEWKMVNDRIRSSTNSYIHALETNPTRPSFSHQITEKVDRYSHQLMERTKTKALRYMQANKMVGLVGGDHSCALGLIQACAQRHEAFGILQIDAHADLRRAYQGFTYSHASVMYNALELPQVSKLVQVGLRHYCEEEAQLIAEAEGRIVPFLDKRMKQAIFQGKHWLGQCEEIVNNLPQKVYISFDIDGLSPHLCPGTGTPVPGGLAFEEAMCLIEQVIRSGKEIIGFDLCEVAPSEQADWDAIVGSYVLYKLGVFMAKSQGRL